MAQLSPRVPQPVTPPKAKCPMWGDVGANSGPHTGRDVAGCWSGRAPKKGGPDKGLMLKPEDLGGSLPKGWVPATLTAPTHVSMKWGPRLPADLNQWVPLPSFLPRRPLQPVCLHSQLPAPQAFTPGSGSGASKQRFPKTVHHAPAAMTRRPRASPTQL